MTEEVDDRQAPQVCALGTLLRSVGTAVAAMLLLAGGTVAAAPAFATTPDELSGQSFASLAVNLAQVDPGSSADEPGVDEEPGADDPAGPRPADPDVDCVTGGKDVVDLPGAQTRLGADSSWLLSRGGGVTVAVVDSGVDPWNPQLAGRVDAGVDTVFDGATGNADCLGQGTAVAGLVAAGPVEGVGFHGVAPDARIFPVRIVADELAVSPGALATGIDAAVGAGAQVVLVTVSAASRSDALDAAVAAAVAADVLLVAPAIIGTASPEYAYPAAYEEVLAVGAIDVDGAALDEATPGEPIIDVVAPGTAVVALLPGKGHSTELTGPVPAAAYVAGVAALVRSAHPELTADLVRARLEATADRPGTQPPDPLLGWGVVNVQVALSALITAETSAVAAVDPVVVRPPRAEAAPDRTTEHRAIWIFGGGVAAGLVLLVLVVVVPRGRRTAWRPARSTPVLPRRG